MHKKKAFRGILCLPVSPFTKKDEVDEEGLRQIIEILIRDGVDGLVPTGATGEFPYLIHEERKKMWEIVIDQTNGRVPVLAGTGAISTKEAVQFNAEALDVGCDGVMLSHPLLKQTTDEETYEYFNTIISEVDIPILLYNNPMLGRSMNPDLILKMADDFDNVVSYKEDHFDHHRFTDIIRRCKDKITLFTGSPAALLSFLVHGAHGALIAEFQSFPHLVKGLINSFDKGDMEKALYYHEMILKMFHIIKIHFVGASFAGRYKAIWALRGADIDLRVRAPNTPVKPEQLEKAKPEFLKLDVTDDWYVK
jgi:4-hydroxy-tetrahydrodipicolinate synthase